MLSKSGSKPFVNFFISLPIANFVNSYANQAGISSKKSPNRVHSPSLSALQAAAFPLISKLSATHLPTPPTPSALSQIANFAKSRANQAGMASKNHRNYYIQHHRLKFYTIPFRIVWLSGGEGRECLLEPLAWPSNSEGGFNLIRRIKGSYPNMHMLQIHILCECASCLIVHPVRIVRLYMYLCTIIARTMCAPIIFAKLLLRKNGTVYIAACGPCTAEPCDIHINITQSWRAVPTHYTSVSIRSRSS